MLAIGGLALALAAAGSGVAAETASKPLVPAQISATWLKWNKTACAFQVVPKGDSYDFEVVAQETLR